MKLIEWQYYPKWHLPWCTHLRRSPEYIAQRKKWLLEQLETTKFAKVIEID